MLFDLTQDWEPSGKAVSPTDEIRAVTLTSYVMSNPKSSETEQVFKNFYDTESFYEIFDALRTFVEGYLLGGSSMDGDLDRTVFGFAYDSTPYLFNETVGQEPLLNKFFSPVFAESNEQFESQNTGILTGSIDLDVIARVRFLNGKNYVNLQMPINSGLALELAQVYSKKGLDVFSGATNGMQWSPTAEESLSVFDPSLLTQFVCQKQGSSDYTDPIN